MSGGGGLCRAKTELRWMRFVDGENLVFQGEKFLKERFNLSDDRDIDSPFFIKDKFIWLPLTGWSAVTNYNLPAQWAVKGNGNYQTPEAIRAYYYTVISGQKEVALLDTENAIWNTGFTPRVFWKNNKKKNLKWSTHLFL